MSRTATTLMEAKSQKCIICGKQYFTFNAQRVTCGAPDCQKKRHAQQMHEFHQRKRKAGKHKSAQSGRASTKAPRASEIEIIMSINEACVRARQAGQSYGMYIANMNSKVHRM